MPHSIPTTHSNEQKIIQDGRRNLPSILFAKGGTNIYIYPENLRAKAMLWLWPLRDVAIIGTGFILSVLALAQSGFLPPLVATFLFAFLSIRVEDAQHSGLPALCRQFSVFETAVLRMGGSG